MSSSPDTGIRAAWCRPFFSARCRILSIAGSSYGLSTGKKEFPRIFRMVFFVGCDVAFYCRYRREGFSTQFPSCFLFDHEMGATVNSKYSYCIFRLIIKSFLFNYINFFRRACTLCRFVGSALNVSITNVRGEMYTVVKT